MKVRVDTSVLGKLRENETLVERVRAWLFPPATWEIFDRREREDAAFLSLCLAIRALAERSEVRVLAQWLSTQPGPSALPLLPWDAESDIGVDAHGLTLISVGWNGAVSTSSLGAVELRSSLLERFEPETLEQALVRAAHELAVRPRVLSFSLVELGAPAFRSVG